MVKKLFTKLERRMDKHSENFNRETENVRRYQTDITELKETTAGLRDTAERAQQKTRWSRTKDRST